MQLRGRPRPVNPFDSPIQHWCIAGSTGILRRRAKRTGEFLGQRFDNQGGAPNTEQVVQLAQRHVRRNVNSIHEQDVAGIHPFVHLHRRHAAARFAVKNRPVDRRGAAVSRQQRSMNIDTAMSGRLEHALRQYLTKRHYHGDIRLPCRKLNQKGGVFHPLDSDYLKPHLQSRLLDRRRAKFLAATFGPVRLADDAANFIAGSDDCFQAGDRKIRRSHKNDPLTRHSLISLCSD